MTARAFPQIVDLPEGNRDSAIPIIKQSFVGIYRWHAKRTLREISRVRAAQLEGQLAGISMLDRLTPEIGYVYYLAVGESFRSRGLGGALLDDAITLFRNEGAKILYGAAEEENTPSIRLFSSRGFRRIERDETGFREGGLGAWGLRSRMMLVHGEVLMGRFLVDRSIES
ncbi:MAG: GNAT family N-acetyltransferase [Thermoplasmata archaeon]